MSEQTIKRIDSWIKDYEKTQPGNVCMDDATFEGSAYYLLQSARAELSAAPELLEACKDLLEHFKAECNDTMEARNRRRFAEAQQAIAKASSK